MHENTNTLHLRVLGFILSLALTILAYYIIVDPEYFHLGPKEAIATIFGLALIQAIIQLIFFLNVWSEKGPPWNLGVFISTVSIVFIIVAFSIWIMDHLNYMMPM